MLRSLCSLSLLLFESFVCLSRVQSLHNDAKWQLLDVLQAWVVTVAQESTPTSTTSTERSSHESRTTPLCVNLVPLFPCRHARNPSRPRPQPRPQPPSLRRRGRSTVARGPRSAHRRTVEVPAAAVATVTAAAATTHRRPVPGELRRSVPEVAKSSRSTSPSAPCAQFSDE